MTTLNNTPGAKSFPGAHDIYRTELSNGITLLVRSNFNSPSVYMGGYLHCGSLFDPMDKLGISNFTSLALMRGTQHQTFQQIYGSLEAVGASLGFGAGVHNVSFGAHALNEDLPLVMQLLSDALRLPAFPTEPCERLRAQMLSSLAIRAQDTGDQADMALDALLFPNHPYGRPEDGFIETVKNITLEDLQRFHQRHYGPNGMVIAIVGGIEPQQALEGVAQALGDWENADQPAAPSLPEILPMQAGERKHIAIPGKYQTDLVMGVVAMKRTAPDYFAASLGNNVLGQFGMMGRIGDVVREKAGLAYHASTSISASLLGGSWEVSAGVNPENLQKAIDLIHQELRRFASEPVQAEELQDSQANYIGRLPLALESNAGVVNALLNIERFDLGLDYYQNYAGRVKAVTPEMVLEAARKYWTLETMGIVSAGPALSDAPLPA